MADKLLQRAKVSGHLLKNQDTGHLANGCNDAVITCEDCEGNGPITATITTVGGCLPDTTDCGPPGFGWKCSDDHCVNTVVSLVWDVGNDWWQGIVADYTPGGALWAVRIWCTGTGTWHMRVWGGCNCTTDWIVWVDTVFVPSGCVKSGATGYPTHAGITPVGDPVGECWVDCRPTVALS